MSNMGSSLALAMRAIGDFRTAGAGLGRRPEAAVRALRG
jgi:hypothetical protein